MWHKILFIILFAPLWVNAQATTIETSIKESKNQIGIAYENSSFTAETGNLVGTGFRVSFFTKIYEELSAEVFLSAALNKEASVQNSFTGLGGYVLYSLLGSQSASTKTTLINHASVISETRPSRHNVLVGAGLNQYFLNGTKGVYSASGLGLEIVYRFEVWGINLKVAGRYGMLSAASTDVKVTGYDFGVVIPF